MAVRYSASFQELFLWCIDQFLSFRFIFGVVVSLMESDVQKSFISLVLSVVSTGSA